MGVIAWPICPRPQAYADNSAPRAEILIRSCTVDNLVWYRRRRTAAYKKGKVIFLARNIHVIR
jgi:hypothetical protein